MAEKEGYVSYVDKDMRYAYISGYNGISYLVSAGTIQRTKDAANVLKVKNRVSFNVWNNKGKSKDYANDIRLV